MEQSETGDGTEDRESKDRPRDKRRTSETSRKQSERPKVILDDWQKEALEHDGDLLLCTGRQVGKTFIMSQKAANYMINHKNSKIICCSLTEDQAQLIIIMTLDYLERNYKDLIAKPYSKNVTKNKIILKNGSQILARPVGNTGDAVRGFTGDILILDEASRFAEFIFTASKPTLLTTGGQIWMCSTPFGKKGYFYECYLNRSKRFKVIETNSWDVVHNRQISEVWTENKRTQAIEFLENEKADMSELQFAQEYLGKFVEDLRQFFTDDIINQCCTLKRPTQIFQQQVFFCGIDVARMGDDQTSFEIIQRYSATDFRHVENITTKKTLTTATYDRILDLDSNYNFKKIGIDAGTGALGVGIYDFLLRSPVKRKIVPISNITRNLDHLGEKKKSLMKEDMYVNLLAMMERGIIKLLDDDDVKASLRSVQYEYTTEENYSDKVRIYGNFTHIAEGLIRAAWLAKEKSLNAFIDFI
jgi:hypothetical protein